MVVKIPKILKDTKKIFILVNNKPIQLVTKIFPQKSLRSVCFNIRMEQASFLRAAILDNKNIWNISSKKVIVNLQEVVHCQHVIPLRRRVNLMK